ncbi:MAG TPA: alkaline phosphatase D family protein [Solirubrobacterales bacterium]|nr:alkaline phosphatase D family protein [Solirubrobacterales bacterium]
MPKLVLGPLLRYVSETEATVWVETDRACEVEVLGRRERTFRVEGHHYALVCLADLEPGTSLPYEVSLDGERVWPESGSEFPPSVLRTIDPDRPLQIVFGSCRVAVPHRPPYTLTKDEDPEHGREIDALYALAVRMREQPPDRWPDVLLMLGDQVYADEDAPETRAFIRERRGTDGEPGEEVADFEEYTRLYRESWGDETIRWLLSTVPSAMIFDDHDIHDDWNTSSAWLEEMRRKPWWHRRITGGLVSYWVYQHLGNLSPEAIERRRLLEQVRKEPDAGPMLHEWAADADWGSEGRRWSHSRTLGGVRIVMLDSREGRILGERPRRMFDEDEWEWLEQVVTGDVRHLIVADTLPIFLPQAIHSLESWSDAVAAGAWSPLLKGMGERIRRALDLEHWGAFPHSFERIVELMASAGAGERGAPPSSIVTLGGDIHHAYLARVTYPEERGVESPVWQAVCSPFRNALSRREERIAKAGDSRLARAIGRGLTRLAGVEEPDVEWRLEQPPTFDNQFATLDYDGDRATVRIEKTVPGDWRRPHIETSLERELARGPAGMRSARAAAR